MGTPLTTVYESFLGKVTDYSFIKLNKEDKLEYVLRKYLNSAITRFTNCNQDLSIDEETKAFVSDLTLHEIEILSTYMTYYYVKSKILNVKNMEQNLSEREFRKYSEANHLKSLLAVEQSIQGEASSLQSDYSLLDGLDSLQ